MAGQTLGQSRGFSFALRTIGDRLELVALHHPAYGAISADWDSQDLRRRIAAGKRQLLARAVGLNKRASVQVLDATAGLGRDGFTLAALGAQVTLAERHPSVAALLADAYRRAMQNPTAAPAAARLSLVRNDARNVMAQGWDVIYLDPMYPHAGRSALAKKELQLLRELTGGDPDADDLLIAALANARHRVVVKRPVKAPHLAGRKPSLVLAGTQARFDIYLCAS